MTIGDGRVWNGLVESVEAGELTMEPGTARACAQRCTALIAELGMLRDRVAELGEVKGFGILPSGVALAEKFSKKAVGGEYSMVQALTDHITEVEGMREVFEKIEAQYAATDDNTAVAFEGVDGGR